MQLGFPEAEVVGLIANLEADDCPIPASESSRLSMVSPRAARQACDRGVDLRKKGDLAGANGAFAEMLHLQDTINPTALWAWARALLLAKEFRYAQLLMHAEFANDYRGMRLFNPFIWMNVHLNLPGFEVEWRHDGSVPNYEINGVNWFENPRRIAERICSLGNDGDYWKSNYEWTSGDYKEFKEYFSPRSRLAYDNSLHTWAKRGLLGSARVALHPYGAR